MSIKTDPYDFAATLIGDDQRQKIAEFWQVFTANADAISAMFSQRDGAQADVAAIMEALRPVSTDLMWEFGPSDRGHSLCVTAEFRDELRPLARLVMQMAPDLAEWRFNDVRSAEQPDQLEQMSRARFGVSINLEKIEAEIGRNGRIDQIGFGQAEADDIITQMLNLSALLLGEELERDWIGYVDAEPKKSGGLLSRLGRKKAAQFDPVAWLEMMQTLIAKAKDEMPDIPYSALDFEDRSVTLSSDLNLAPEHPRTDLITFTAVTVTYLHGVLGSARFSSRCHSKFDEWFMYLCIPRTNETPFDQVSDRGDIEEKLHHVLSASNLGGQVAGGHGTENVYIDFAVTDVGKAIALLQSEFRGEKFATDATLHFLDQGLNQIVTPLSLGKSVH